MPKFVRVKNRITGSEYTVADTVALGEDVEPVDSPATNRDGKPLPPSHKTTLTVPGSEGSTTVEIPAGDPEDSWTVKQLEAYALREQVDLGSASTKAEKLSVLTPNRSN